MLLRCHEDGAGSSLRQFHCRIDNWKSSDKRAGYTHNRAVGQRYRAIWRFDGRLHVFSGCNSRLITVTAPTTGAVRVIGIALSTTVMQMRLSEADDYGSAISTISTVVEANNASIVSQLNSVVSQF